MFEQQSNHCDGHMQDTRRVMRVLVCSIPTAARLADVEWRAWAPKRARRLEGVGGVTLAETRLILSWRGRETEVDSLA